MTLGEKCLHYVDQAAEGSVSLESALVTICCRGQLTVIKLDTVVVDALMSSTHGCLSRMGLATSEHEWNAEFKDLIPHHET